MLRISGTGASHVGLVREHNEDAAFVGPTCVLVADGVGGGAAGEVAAATTAYVVSATALARPEDDPVAVLTDAVATAQQQVAVGARQRPEREGMATTLTALVTDGTRFGLAHIGDSRGYIFRDGDLVRVTRDHTYVQDMVEQGRLDDAEAGGHPWRNVVLRTVNGADEPADVTSLDLRPGDRVLLASDGLTDFVSEARIADLLARKPDDDAVGALVAAALGAGGRDNVTCVLATVVEGARLVGDGQRLGAMEDLDNIVDPAAVRMSGPTGRSA
ncbi:MAG TPA: protein phosphatase 2C domain-containing protein [Marmoricola sp.]|nr:protein phosphatase 2C domain-containing protein [Marmoricola sp.]